MAALADYFQRKRDVLEHRFVGKQLEVLEHATDVAAQIRHTPVAHGGQVLVRDVNMTTCGLDFARNGLDEGGFTGTRMTHQEQELTRVNLQAHVFQSRFVRLSRIDFRHMVEYDDRASLTLRRRNCFELRQR